MQTWDYRDFFDDIRRRTHFLKNAINDPNIGAATRSSEYMTRKVLERLTKPLHNVIEYGAGDGIVTKALLQELAPEGKLLAIESNARFIQTLRQINDERLEVLHGKVEDLLPEQIFFQADAVISSIPCFFLTPEDRLAIVAHTYKILVPGGNFIVFHQYRRLMLEPLNKYFTSVSVLFVPLNILPCFILDARK